MDVERRQAGGQTADRLGDEETLAGRPARRELDRADAGRKGGSRLLGAVQIGLEGLRLGGRGEGKGSNCGEQGFTREGFTREDFMVRRLSNISLVSETRRRDWKRRTTLPH